MTPLAVITSPTLVGSYLTTSTHRDVTTSNKGTMSTFVYFVAGKRHLKHNGAFLVIGTYKVIRVPSSQGFYHGSNTREIVYRFANL